MRCWVVNELKRGRENQKKIKVRKELKNNKVSKFSSVAFLPRVISPKGYLNT